jgi:hypothetical protein
MPAKNAAKNPQAQKFTDFRSMLDKVGNEIDVVLVSTPDHTHFPVAMASMELGKPVFVQKPLAHNIWQVRTLRKAMHYYGVDTVMGNQGHTTDGIRYIKQWFDSGILGEVREVHCWTDRPIPYWFIKPEQIPISNLLLIPLAGQMLTHFTVREERGIDKTTMVIDDLASLFHLRAEARKTHHRPNRHDLCRSLRFHRRGVGFYHQLRY